MGSSSRPSLARPSSSKSAANGMRRRQRRRRRRSRGAALPQATPLAISAAAPQTAPSRSQATARARRPPRHVELDRDAHRLRHDEGGGERAEVEQLGPQFVGGRVTRAVRAHGNEGRRARPLLLQVQGMRAAAAAPHLPHIPLARRDVVEPRPARLASSAAPYRAGERELLGAGLFWLAVRAPPPHSAAPTRRSTFYARVVTPERPAVLSSKYRDARARRPCAAAVAQQRAARPRERQAEQCTNGRSKCRAVEGGDTRDVTSPRRRSRRRPSWRWWTRRRSASSRSS